MGRTDLLQHLDHLGTVEVEANVQPRREPAEGVDDGQNPQLAAGGELVMDEVHGPRSHSSASPDGDRRAASPRPYAWVSCSGAGGPTPCKVCRSASDRHS